MIGRLEGVLCEKAPARLMVDVGGVGYEVWIPLSTFTELPDEGKVVSLRIHTHVREDAIQLFGFASARERSVFELLIRTSGIGPKLAIGVLSGIAPERLLEAVRAGDIATLRGVPGVGQKTAERIVVELRERAAELLRTEELGAAPPARGARLPGGMAAEHALSALLNLGYARPQAQRVVEEASAEVGEAAPLEVLVRAALRRLSR